MVYYYHFAYMSKHDHLMLMPGTAGLHSTPYIMKITSNWTLSLTKSESA